MFWIGFIVGMVVFALIRFGWFILCMKVLNLSKGDFTNLVDATNAMVTNRDSRIEVWCEDTEEKVFEAGFKYPWSDEVDE